jgi:hypothetical protein
MDNTRMTIIDRGDTTLPGTKSKPATDIDILTSIEPSTLEDSHVYVHCYFNNTSEDMLIRIWKTTFLVDKSSSTKSQLVHAENISIAPVWTQVPTRQRFSFLLIFSGLPKTCKTFDLVEEISQPGGFYIGNISRNQTDVYHLDIN